MLLPLTFPCFYFMSNALLPTQPLPLLMYNNIKVKSALLSNIAIYARHAAKIKFQSSLTHGATLQNRLKPKERKK